MSAFKKLYKIVAQIAILTAVSWFGTYLTGRFGWPVPGNIVGMLFMVLLLQTRVIRLEWVETGGSWLLGNMLLFFVPAAVGIIQYQQLMVTSGGRILLVIVLSTVAVMVCTGVVVDRLARVRERGGSGNA
ncbi:MAG: holin [Symbiobacteriaceae bacterium]|jgi:holin-like protein|nr:holin [Symbiobacteriaceae bacterium]